MPPVVLVVPRTSEPIHAAVEIKASLTGFEVSSVIIYLLRKWLLPGIRALNTAHSMRISLVLACALLFTRSAALLQILARRHYALYQHARIVALRAGKSQSSGGAIETAPLGKPCAYWRLQSDDGTVSRCAVEVNGCGGYHQVSRLLSYGRQRGLRKDKGPELIVRVALSG